MKILVVDDNPDNVELVKDILSLAGYQLYEAYNGPTALELARQHHPDLILLDINMPHMNGFEVLAKLKADDVTAATSVIMLTALSDIDDRVKGLSYGADDYLTKPFDARELQARVARSLRAKVVSDDLRDKQAAIRNTFERFVAAAVVDELLKYPESVQLGGKLQEVTVLFADLQGFTSLSERTPPEELLRVLNLYHTFIVKIITFYGGIVDKFLGDGVMALYNTPKSQDDHIARAVKTALHIQDELHWFYQKIPKPDQHLQINFGIHSGLAVVGNVGTENLMDFTAVGDTVNVAARLQSLADDGQILVSQVVYDAVQEMVFGRSKGPLPVKGRQEPVQVYRISNTYFD